jgi:ferredoxin
MEKDTKNTIASSLTRRGFMGAMGMLGATAAGMTVVNLAKASESADAAASSTDTPALTESESGTKTVEGGEVDHKEMYGSTAREAIDLGATTEELDALLLDEPEVTEDLTLPDGTVVDKAYVALRNKLNRMSEGLANDPLENSYENIMRLWTPEEAAQEVLCPNQKWFTAFDYVRSAREHGQEVTLDEATDILENLVAKRNIVGVTRADARWYFLLAWVDGVWETHIPETEDITFVQGGINGSDYGTGSSYPILHICPVDSSIVDTGVIDPYRDWRLIVDSFESFGIGECICRKAAMTRGDAEMDGYTREHVWKEGASGENFISTCMVFGQYADFFIENGLAERVTKEEMIRNIEYGIEDGFVPEMYWAQHPEIMCLCKSDMCDVLTSYRRVDGNTSNFAKASAYQLVYDKETCIKCGLCVERCPMKAISWGDDGYCVMDTACVACGQCAYKCPVSARKLTLKEDYVDGNVGMPFDLCDDFKWRAEERMQKGYVRDFVGTSLDDNQADNDFAAKLEALRAAEE